MSYPHILHHGAIAGVTREYDTLLMDARCRLFPVAEVSPEGRAEVGNGAIDFSFLSAVCRLSGAWRPRYSIRMFGSSDSYALLYDVR